MNALEAAIQVLKEAGQPLHYFEITKRILDRGLWETSGKTPEATVNAQIAMSIKRKADGSPFQRAGKGVFALRESKMPESTGHKTARQMKVAKKENNQTISFVDAAERVLEKFGDKQPMHYRGITDKALELNLLNTAGKTPASTMYAQVLGETKRRQKRGENPRFVLYGKGFVGLTRWMGRGLAFQIEQHNKNIRRKLHERLAKYSPAEFEELIGQLLAALGFEEVAVTARSGDGGIDVRGTLVVGDVVKTSMAVQVKRWKNNVQAPIVQQVRGSLGTHEQGLIITTSDFSPGARKEAERPDAIPVGLMNGEQLVRLLLENDIGVTRRSHDVFELGEENIEVNA